MPLPGLVLQPGQRRIEPVRRLRSDSAEPVRNGPPGRPEPYAQSWPCSVSMAASVVVAV